MVANQQQTRYWPKRRCAYYGGHAMKKLIAFLNRLIEVRPVPARWDDWMPEDTADEAELANDR